MKSLLLLLLAMLPFAPIRAQSIMAAGKSGGRLTLFPGDAAVFELKEVKASLPCAVTPSRTELGFDFVFHAGQSVHIRMRDLAGEGNVLVTIFRVVPEDSPDKPVYFEQKWRVPPLSENASGAVALDSSFTVGEGNYEVDWLLRDNSERVCSAFWKISARMPIKGGPIVVGLPRGAVAAAGSEASIERDSSKADPAQRPPVTILLNLGPDFAGGASISQAQSEALLAILRSILRDPRIGDVSITAFNLEHRQVIFEQENIRQLDFSALKTAMNALTLGTVAANQLAEKNAEAQFLVRLAAERLARRPSDSLIFVGPKTVEESGLNRELLQQLGAARSPVFYLTYLPLPQANPWPDLIGSTVRRLRGREFSISRPSDLVSAWSKIVLELGTTSWHAPER
jgi:hypothetical protein